MFSRLFFLPVCAFFLVLLLGNACTSSPKETAKKSAEPAAAPPPAAVARRTIVFFGNSLTAAYQLSPEQGFPALIQQKMDSLQWPWQCINAGLSGETTADGVERVDWVLQQPVDVFVLELGGNDVLRGLPMAASKKNLQAILDKVKAKYPDCQLVVAGMKAPGNLGKTYTTAFQELFPALARSNKAVLIPFLLEGVAAEKDLNLEDGIHPNAAGHTIVAANVWKVLEPVLRKRLPATIQ